MTSTAHAADWRTFAIDPAFLDYSNEALYEALCDATAPLDVGLKELQYRLKPIIINGSKAFLRTLSWTFDDAMGEALILLWELVVKRSFKRMRAQFHTFFMNAWRNRLNRLFERAICKGPVMLGDYRVGMSKDRPIFVCGYAFHEKAVEYREKRRERSAKEWAAKKAARPPREEKPILTDDERRAKRNAAAKAARAAETPEHKAARLAKDAEYEKARRARETQEQREHRLEKTRERAKRAYEKLKAEETPEQREARLNSLRAYRAKQTPEQKAINNAKRVELARAKAAKKRAEKAAMLEEAGLIKIAEYAELVGMSTISCRKHAENGRLKTAQKIKTAWYVNKDEPYPVR